MVTIIGRGNFGTFLNKIIGEALIQVENFDVDEIKHDLTGLVIIAVPVRFLDETIEKIKNKISFGSIVLDTCSVKKYPCQVLSKLKDKCQVAGTHPLFGPNSKTDDDTIIICDINLTEQAKFIVCNIFNKIKSKVLWCSCENHDEMMAYQVLAHTISRSINKMGFESKVQTPSIRAISNICNLKISDVVYEDMCSYNEKYSRIKSDFLQIMSGK